MDDGMFAVKQLFLLLKLHLCMDLKSRGGAYTQSIIMQLLIVLYQKAKNLPQWQMMKDELSVFNEEAGEITFSQLARASVGDTQKRKFDHMDRLYRLLHIYGDVEQDQLGDIGGTAKASTSRRKIDPDGEEVAAVVAFMKTKIREIRSQKMMEYDGSVDSWRSRTHAVREQVALKARTAYWSDKMVDVLGINIAKAKAKFYKNDWADQFKAIWPGCAIPESAAEFQSGDEMFAGSDHDGEGEVDADFEPLEDAKDAYESGDSGGMDEKHGNDRSEADSDYDEEDDRPIQRRQGATYNSPVRQAINRNSFAVNKDNIMLEGRGERAGRGARKPDSFPLVNTFYVGMNTLQKPANKRKGSD
jgi:hypothetical protein